MLKTICIGNLGKDCIVNQHNGKYVVNYNVAHTEKYKVNGVENTKTTWLECSQWFDQQPKVAQYLKKGQQVFVEGQVEARGYTKNDGSHGVSLAMRVFTLQLLGGGQRSQNDESSENNRTDSPASDISEPVDDLPF